MTQIFFDQRYFRSLISKLQSEFSKYFSSNTISIKPDYQLNKSRNISNSKKDFSGNQNDKHQHLSLISLISQNIENLLTPQTFYHNTSKFVHCF